jgi:hypothetical protein
MSTAPLPSVHSSDGGERVQQFLARHGGPGAMREREGQTDQGTRGWSEVYAADGYALRCEWSNTGESLEMQFSEIPPR